MTNLQNDAEILVLMLLQSLTRAPSESQTLSFSLLGPGLEESLYGIATLKRIAQCIFILRAIEATASTAQGSNVMILTSTERDLYYRDPRLFSPMGQRGVHACIDRLCAWMEAAALSRRLGQCVGSTQGTSEDGGLHTVGGPAKSLPSHARCAALFTTPARVLQQLRDEATVPPHMAAECVYTRERLGITATGKSIIAGHLQFDLRGTTVSVLATGRGGVTVTGDMGVAARNFCVPATPGCSTGSSSLLVVVEKECVLRTMIDHEAALEARQGAKGHHQYVLLCTKGYPCVASRSLLRRLHVELPSLPLLAFVDGDPHGLCIVLTLMGLMGSNGRTLHSLVSSTRQRGCVRRADSIIIPIRWVGVKPSLYMQARSAGDVSSSSPGLSLLTSDDMKRLETIVAVALTTLTDFNKGGEVQAAGDIDSNDCATIRSTLHDILAEARWMQRARLKCEIQTVCGHHPLRLLESQLQGL